MNTRQYFEEVAKSAFARLANEPSDRSLVIAATILVFHTVDWLSEETGASLSALRRSIGDRFPDFVRLEAAANTHKHRKLEKDGGGRLKAFLGMTDPLTPSSTEVFTYRGEPYTYRGQPIAFTRPPVYRFSDGETRSPVKLIRSAIAAIEEELDCYKI
jgi:hypothetical protein